MQATHQLLDKKAVETESLYYDDYNLQVTTYRIISAHTLTNGKKHEVDLNSIEDKSNSNFTNNFDDIHRIKFAYPNVEVHSLLNFHLETDNKQLTFPQKYFTYQNLYA